MSKPSYRTFDELFILARSEIEEATPQAVAEMMASDSPPVVIDIREQDEWDEGFIPGAVHMHRGHLEMNIEQIQPDRSAPLVLYCAGGVRSALAAANLLEMGYQHPISMIGGYGMWKDQGLRFTIPRSLTGEQRRRYSRHALIPEVGESGQLQMLDAKILLIGAGGLGSPNALYLAAAGVGTIGIVDSDVVDESNLQRQVIHTTDQIGQPKVESAELAIHALNPHVNVVKYHERLTEENARSIIEAYDIIIDGGDNFPTRYLVNDVAVALGKPNISASILSFDGQLTTLIPGDGPCYRCIFPEPPPAGMAPSCGEAGVLGVLPGVMGILQATEALKLVLGLGQPLVGRLLVFDALAMSFFELKVRRNPDCPICGHLPMKVQSDQVAVTATS
jgi:molybdopterin/thiamine biosynthesis adenylyltransferase/rhodanese-related sulfurtransferase